MLGFVVISYLGKIVCLTSLSGDKHYWVASTRDGSQDIWDRQAGKARGQYSSCNGS